MNRLVRNIALRLCRMWWRIAAPTSVGVRVIVTNPAGQVVLVRHSYGSPYLYLPGGGVKRKEAARSAAARELHEELGLTVDDSVLELRGVHHSRNEWRSDHVIVYATMVDVLPRTSSSGEISEVVTVNREALNESCSPATSRRLTEYWSDEHSTSPW